jgi:hypothetical protein
MDSQRICKHILFFAPHNSTAPKNKKSLQANARNSANLTRQTYGQKEERTDNIGIAAIWRLKCFYETFVQGSTAVILLNFCAKNPPHRQAEKRYLQC